MRIPTTVALLALCTTPTLAQVLTPQQQGSAPVVHVYFDCGARLAFEYGLALPDEPASDLAVVAAQKCRAERGAALAAIQASFPTGDWEGITRLIDDQFSSHAMTAAIEARLLSAR
jgi:hypothetical protein